MHPIDTLKTRIQQLEGKAVKSTLLFRNLHRGILTSSLGAGPQVGFIFYD